MIYKKPRANCKCIKSRPCSIYTFVTKSGTCLTKCIIITIKNHKNKEEMPLFYSEMMDK